ncbi:glycosyltransferase family 2 protein [uncultured Pseudoteredinibacter sp.]|uniref:glycosyltransferase family 2 protein n=1 Tax=uncultured Pseudoteredinibacter sp. TaxID=1641701 RepID=UPI002614CABF|nr:glycosyltransferase family 2 protein [uncultured Pseudoteredinibacter sp.]
MDLNVNKELLSIVVSYQPDLDQLKNLLDSLAKQSHVCLVDNGSRQAEEIAQLAESRVQFFFPQSSNIGLADALNIGIQCAEVESYQAVLLFDQDSTPVGDYAANMVGVYDSLQSESRHRCAVIGPRLLDPETGSRTDFKLFSGLVAKADKQLDELAGVYESSFVITSGSYIPLDIIRRVGPMRSSYFIDNIDLEWCFRATSMGLLVLGSDNVSLIHSIGEKQENTLFKRLGFKHHNPKRFYYTTRNRIDLYRQKYSPTGWKVRDIVRFALKTSLLLLLSKDRKQIWHYTKLAFLGRPLEQ